jgi:hypothetical protein
MGGNPGPVSIHERSILITKYETVKVEIDEGTPVLDFLARSVGPNWSEILGYVAGEPDGLARLEKEIRTVRLAIAKASDGRHCGGPADLRKALADAEAAAERVGEPELRAAYERRAREIRQQLAEG